MNAPLRHPVTPDAAARQDTAAAPVDIYAADRRISTTVALDALDQCKFQSVRQRSAFSAGGRQ